jgi:hypothetical protein
MSQRQAVTKAIAVRYKRASRGEKWAILDELCATTGRHRNHARREPLTRRRPQHRPTEPQPNKTNAGYTTKRK